MIDFIINALGILAALWILAFLAAVIGLWEPPSFPILELPKPTSFLGHNDG